MSGLYILTLLALAVAVGWAVVRLDENVRPNLVRVPFDCDTCGRASHIDVPADDVWTTPWQDVELVCGECIPEEVER